MVIGQVLKTEDSLTNLISTILQFALTPLLTKVVKLSTPLIGVLSAASKASYYVLIANTKSLTMVSSLPKTSLRWKCFQTYLTCLACLEGGVGNIVSRCNCHFIPNFPVLCFAFDSRWNKYKNTEIWWNCPSLYSRSMLAQLVPQRELGKVYGLLAILDAALPFIGWPPLFKLSFHNYFSTAPG